MKARLASIILAFTLISAFAFVPSATTFAKDDKKPHPVKGVKVKGKFDDATISITQFAVNADGKLVANGLVTSATRGTLGTFSNALVTVQSTTSAQGTRTGDYNSLAAMQQESCSILTLSLAPIKLDLLGLVVETTAINLVITGETGPGNLLGNLLCGLTGILDPAAQAQALNQVLALIGGSLSSGSPLTGLLPITITKFAKRDGQLVAVFYVEGANGQAVGPFSTPAQIIQPPDGACDVLSLTLGPIDLNLLGLRIQLYGETPEDPITILIYAVPGPGNLLGNLICGLVGILDPNPTVAQLNEIIRLLNRILKVLG